MRAISALVVFCCLTLVVLSQPFEDVVVSELSLPFLGRPAHTFFADVREKTLDHPRFGVGSTMGLLINGFEGATITVNRGETYRFIFIGIDHSHALILTPDESGGLDAPLWTKGLYPNSFSASTFGQTLYWTVPLDAPDTLWYQDRFGELAGGRIDIHGGGETIDQVFDVDIASGTTAFFVDVESKLSHPWQGPDEPPESSSNGYVIDGTQGKTLHLIRGRTYAFIVGTAGHPLFLSTSDIGGPGAVQAGKVWSSGVVGDFAEWSEEKGPKVLLFTPGRDSPAVLYYQCALHRRMGGMLIIEDGIDFVVSEKDITDATTGQVVGAEWVVNGNENAPAVMVRRDDNTRWLIETPNSHPVLITTADKDFPNSDAWLWRDIDAAEDHLATAAPDERGLHAWLNESAWGFSVVTLSPRASTPNNLRYASALQEYTPIGDGKIIVVGQTDCIGGTLGTLSEPSNRQCEVVETGETKLKLSFITGSKSHTFTLPCV